MYAKLFASLYQGTLRGNTRCIVVFTNMLAHADAAGWVDMHPRAISEEVGLPISEVEAAIQELESPDPDSRSPDENGKRIIRLDEHRSWGWRIVNHGKYRAMRNEEDRREQNREAQRRWRERQQSSATHKQDKPRKPPSAQAEAEAEAEREATFQVASARRTVEHLPDCPHLEILKAWGEALPTLPQHNVNLWRGARADHLRARWREAAVSEGFKTEADGVEYFRRLFRYVGQSAFLTGKAQSNGRRPFVAELEWLVKPANWAKVLEGKYHA